MNRERRTYRILFTASFALVLGSLWVIGGIKAVAAGTLVVGATFMAIAVRLEIHEIVREG